MKAEGVPFPGGGGGGRFLDSSWAQAEASSLLIPDWALESSPLAILGLTSQNTVSKDGCSGCSALPR